MNIDDPNFTAYALDELEPAERAALAEALRAEPENLKEVAELQSLVAKLRAELAQEGPMELTPARRSALLAAAQAPTSMPRPLRVWIPSAIAACLALVLGVHFYRTGGWTEKEARVTEYAAEPLVTAAPERPTPGATPAAVAAVPPMGKVLMPTADSQPALPIAGAGAKESLAPKAVAEVSKKKEADAFLEKDMPAFAPEGKITLDAITAAPAPMPPALVPSAPATPLAGNIGYTMGSGGLVQSTTVPAAPSLATGTKVPTLAWGEGNLKPSDSGALKGSFTGRIQTRGEFNKPQPAATSLGDGGKAMESRTSGARADHLLAYEPARERSVLRTLAKDGQGMLVPGEDKSESWRFQSSPVSTEAYDELEENSFLTVPDHALSTFSIDVDTASYTNVKRMLQAHERPPKGAVRVEEMINYFKYDYPAAAEGAPCSVTMEAAACPWAPEHRLVRIGLKAREIPIEKRPAANLVFLLDVSGSMSPPNRLPLARQCLRLLTDQLGPEDRVAIAVYAGNSGTVLEPTADKTEIRKALERLEAGGSTNGAAGIQLAYNLARKSFKKGEINRVILATDGDFNVGVTSREALLDLIAHEAKSGVFLTVLGFGYGNLKDATLQTLADRGNGNYAYINDLTEGKRVLVEQMSGTLLTVAKDVKIQVEFNPAQASAYRLIGYEKRKLQDRDFNDDTKDAGEMGSGQTVTALYEVVPAGVKFPGPPAVDELKYQQPLAAAREVAPAAPAAAPAEQAAPVSKELLTLKLRWKAPEGDRSDLLSVPLVDTGVAWEKSSADFRWAASVAGFGMLLRESPHAGSASWKSIEEMARGAKGRDPNGYRQDFLSLVEEAARE